MSDQQWLFSEEPQIVAGKPVLLDIQEDLLARGRAAYGNGVRRVIYQASCGSGKTICAAKQTETSLAKGNSVLHVVHRRRLVDQMIKTLNLFNIYASPIMEGRQRWNSPVYCASRDTLLAMLKNGQDLPRQNLIVWDESHVAGAEIQKWYLANCPEAYWTGYTATPVAPEGRSLAPPYQKLVCMKPTSELLKIGRLCPVKVFDPKSLEKARKRGESVKPVGDPVEHWKKYAAGMPTVVFAAKVSDSLAIVERYKDAGITAEHIDASTPEDGCDESREAVFERSRTGKTMVISNVGVMVEGVDLPWLVCCQILRGCNSLVLWIQATGRVMRSFPGKEFGIVLDHAGAVYDFGPPDSDYKWELNTEKANALANKPPKDRKPVACMACGFIFVGKPACPECGKVLSKKRRKSLLESCAPGDGILTEYAGEQNGHIRSETLNRLWTKLINMGRNGGWSMRRVCAIFTKEAKMPPWKAGLEHKLPYGSEGWAQSAKDWMTQLAE